MALVALRILCKSVVNYYKFYSAIVKYANLVKHQEVLSLNEICDNAHQRKLLCCLHVAEARMRVVGACSSTRSQFIFCRIMLVRHSTISLRRVHESHLTFYRKKESLMPSKAVCNSIICILISDFQYEYPKIPRVAPSPWSGLHVPSFSPLDAFQGFRLWLCCTGRL